MASDVAERKVSATYPLIPDGATNVGPGRCGIVRREAAVVEQRLSREVGGVAAAWLARCRGLRRVSLDGSAYIGSLAPSLPASCTALRVRETSGWFGFSIGQRVMLAAIWRLVEANTHVVRIGISSPEVFHPPTSIPPFAHLSELLINGTFALATAESFERLTVLTVAVTTYPAQTLGPIAQLPRLRDLTLDLFGSANSRAYSRSIGSALPRMPSDLRRLRLVWRGPVGHAAGRFANMLSRLADGCNAVSLSLDLVAVDGPAAAIDAAETAIGELRSKCGAMGVRVVVDARAR